MPRHRAVQAQQGICLISKSRRDCSIPKASNPQHSIGHFSTLRVGRPYRDLRSRYGVPPPNPHSRCRAISLAKPSTFRSPSALASPQFGASFLTHRTDRPRTLPANFTLSHIQSLSSFFSRAPSSRAHNRSPRAFPNAACYTSERRKRFLPCSSHSAARTSLQGGLAPQSVVYSFSQAQRVRFIPKASNPSKVWGFFPSLGTVRPLTTHIQHSAVGQCPFPQIPIPCHNAKPSTLRYLAALVGVPMFRKPQPTKARRRPRTFNAPHAACHFALASPQPPARRGSWRATRIS